MSWTRRPYSRALAPRFVALAVLLAAAPVRDAGAAVPVVPAAAGADRGHGLVGVIVKLDDEPVATYAGGIAGLAATSTAATGAARLDGSSTAVSAYRQHLATRFAA